ncbi:hypothetical protein OXYTRIMIC_011 [Oxytricha trifallax]|uniref:Protein kinase domain-containing protein n=1 Tax=Oxytricha trifallax TaxID=1172189 RepID=A0A073IBG7_9SPIT|nr:hypothetical protein OXYTRIMIC_011 [Oxytricha trifallax]
MQAKNQQTEQAVYIKQKKKRHNTLEGVPEYDPTDEKFTKWCLQFGETPEQRKRPKYLIECDTCKKVRDPIQFRVSKFLKFLRIDGIYKCPINNCQLEPSSNRTEFIHHFNKYHDENQLKEVGISIKLLIKQQNKLTFQQLKKQTQLGKRRKRGPKHRDIQVEPVEVNQNLNTLKLYIEECRKHYILINDNPELEKQLYADFRLFTSFQASDLKQNAESKTQFLNNLKYLLHFRVNNFEHQNQLYGLKLSDGHITTVTRGYYSNFKQILKEDRSQKQLIFKILMNVIESLKELHAHKIIYNGLKTETIMIKSSPKLEVFFANYNHAANTTDCKENQNQTNLKFNNDLTQLMLLILELITSETEFTSIINGDQSKMKENLTNYLTNHKNSNNQLLFDILQQHLIIKKEDETPFNFDALRLALYFYSKVK